MNGKELYLRFDELLKSQGMTKKEFCDKTGIRQTALSNWGSRGTMPSADLALAIARGLGASLDYVLGNSDIAYPDVKNKYTQDESEMIKAYRNLDEESKKQFLAYASFLKLQENKK